MMHPFSFFHSSAISAQAGLTRMMPTSRAKEPVSCNSIAVHCEAAYAGGKQLRLENGASPGSFDRTARGTRSERLKIA